MLKKYELTNETIEVDGVTLYRIRALQNFGDVNTGDLGGFVERYFNLSHEGDCWIYGDARVTGEAFVCGDVHVDSNACVRGDTILRGNITLTGNTEWSLHWIDNPGYDFFDAGLTLENATIQTREDFVRAFPEWCI